MCNEEAKIIVLLVAALLILVFYHFIIIFSDTIWFCSLEILTARHWAYLGKSRSPSLRVQASFHKKRNAA